MSAARFVLMDAGACGWVQVCLGECRLMQICVADAGECKRVQGGFGDCVLVQVCM